MTQSEKVKKGIFFTESDKKVTKCEERKKWKGEKSVFKKSKKEFLKSEKSIFF